MIKALNSYFSAVTVTLPYVSTEELPVFFQQNLSAQWHLSPSPPLQNLVSTENDSFKPKKVSDNMKMFLKNLPMFFLLPDNYFEKVV